MFAEAGTPVRNYSFGGRSTQSSKRSISPLNRQGNGSRTSLQDDDYRDAAFKFTLPVTRRHTVNPSREILTGLREQLRRTGSLGTVEAVPTEGAPHRSNSMPMRRASPSPSPSGSDSNFVQPPSGFAESVRASYTAQRSAEREAEHAKQQLKELQRDYERSEKRQREWIERLERNLRESNSTIDRLGAEIDDYKDHISRLQVQADRAFDEGFRDGTLAQASQGVHAVPAVAMEGWPAERQSLVDKVCDEKAKRAALLKKYRALKARNAEGGAGGGGGSTGDGEAAKALSEATALLEATTEWVSNIAARVAGDTDPQSPPSRSLRDMSATLQRDLRSVELALSGKGLRHAARRPPVAQPSSSSAQPSTQPAAANGTPQQHPGGNVAALESQKIRRRAFNTWMAWCVLARQAQERDRVAEVMAEHVDYRLCTRYFRLLSVHARGKSGGSALRLEFLQKEAEFESVLQELQASLPPASVVRSIQSELDGLQAAQKAGALPPAAAGRLSDAEVSRIADEVAGRTSIQQHMVELKAAVAARPASDGLKEAVLGAIASLSEDIRSNIRPSHLSASTTLSQSLTSEDVASAVRPLVAPLQDASSEAATQLLARVQQLHDVVAEGFRGSAAGDRDPPAATPPAGAALQDLIAAVAALQESSVAQRGSVAEELRVLVEPLAASLEALRASVGDVAGGGGDGAALLPAVSALSGRVAELHSTAEARDAAIVSGVEGVVAQALASLRDDLPPAQGSRGDAPPAADVAEEVASRLRDTLEAAPQPPSLEAIVAGVSSSLADVLPPPPPPPPADGLAELPSLVAEEVRQLLLSAAPPALPEILSGVEERVSALLQARAAEGPPGGAEEASGDALLPAVSALSGRVAELHDAAEARDAAIVSGVEGVVAQALASLRDDLPPAQGSRGDAPSPAPPTLQQIVEGVSAAVAAALPPAPPTAEAISSGVAERLAADNTGSPIAPPVDAIVSSVEGVVAQALASLRDDLIPAQGSQGGAPPAADVAEEVASRLRDTLEAAPQPPSLEAIVAGVSSGLADVLPPPPPPPPPADAVAEEVRQLLLSAAPPALPEILSGVEERVSALLQARAAEGPPGGAADGAEGAVAGERGSEDALAGAVAARLGDALRAAVVGALEAERERHEESTRRLLDAVEALQGRVAESCAAVEEAAASAGTLSESERLRLDDCMQAATAGGIDSLKDWLAGELSRLEPGPAVEACVAQGLQEARAAAVGAAVADVAEKLTQEMRGVREEALSKAEMAHQLEEEVGLLADRLQAMLDSSAEERRAEVGAAEDRIVRAVQQQQQEQQAEGEQSPAGSPRLVNTPVGGSDGRVQQLTDQLLAKDAMLTDLFSELRGLRESINTSQLQLQHQQQQPLGLTSRSCGETSEGESLKEELTMTQRRATLLEEQVQDVASEASALRESLDKSEARCTSLEDDLQKAREHVAELAGAAKKAGAACRERDADADAVHEMEQARQDLLLVREGIASLHDAETAERAQEALSLEAELSACAAELEDARHELQLRDAVVAELRKALADAQPGDVPQEAPAEEQPNQLATRVAELELYAVQRAAESEEALVVAQRMRSERDDLASTTDDLRKEIMSLQHSLEVSMSTTNSPFRQVLDHEQSAGATPAESLELRDMCASLTKEKVELAEALSGVTTKYRTALNKLLPLLEARGSGTAECSPESSADADELEKLCEALSAEKADLSAALATVTDKYRAMLHMLEGLLAKDAKDAPSD